MKIKDELFLIMKEAITSIVKDEGLSHCRESLALNVRGALWLMWGRANFQLRNDNTHPFFARGVGKRIIGYRPGFDVYSYYDGTVNDDHIETALIKIAKELKLIS